MRHEPELHEGSVCGINWKWRGGGNVVPRCPVCPDNLLGKAAGDPKVLSAALDAVMLDFEPADAREIDWLVIRVAAGAERVEIFGARPPLEDVDPGGIHRIGRDREVEAPRCFAGEAHSTGTCHDVGVSVRWIADEVTRDDKHPRIVPAFVADHRGGWVGSDPPEDGDGPKFGVYFRDAPRCVRKYRVERCDPVSRCGPAPLVRGPKPSSSPRRRFPCDRKLFS